MEWGKRSDKSPSPLEYSAMEAHFERRILNFFSRRWTTMSGTNPFISPPKLATSLMVLEEMKK